MHFSSAGDVEHGHIHPFDHLTLLAYGSLQVTVNGKAEHEHELVALEDNTVAFCIHALRDGNGVDDILDPLAIPLGVDPRSLANTVVF
mgnify:CR=1 FL=1